MTEIEEKPSPEVLQETWKTLKRQMMYYAFNKRKLDAWTLKKLQDIELFKGEFTPIGEELDIEILKDTEHPKRENLPAGPLLLYHTLDEKKKHIIEYAELILSENEEIREVALSNLDPMLHDEYIGVTPKTKLAIEENSEALLSFDAGDWRPAALLISKALNNDMLVAIHGVRQCISCKPIIKAGLEVFLPRMLSPEVSSFDSIEMEINNPQNQEKQLHDILEHIIATASSFTEACKLFYRHLGHLPIAPHFGLPRLAETWLEKHPETDVWHEIWEWANTERKPLARYHASCVFISNPDLIPSECIPDLWKEIQELVCSTSGQATENPEHLIWKLQQNITKHYTHLFESYFNNGIGPKISCLAWWLGERITSILLTDPDNIEFYYENWILPESQRSSHIWHVASSKIDKSVLRNTTFTVPAPWAYSLFCLLGQHLAELRPQEQTEEVRSDIHEALLSQIIPSLPIPQNDSEKVILAFDYSMTKFIEKWKEFQEEVSRKSLEELLQLSIDLCDPERLCAEIKNLDENILFNQQVLCVALRTVAFREASISDCLWDIISDQQWRFNVLGNADPQVIGLLMEAISITQISAREEWFFTLPHFIAELCEQVDNKDRKEELFLFLLKFCLASDTVSAIQRLLHGEHKEDYAAIVAKYRSRIEAMDVKYPPWVAGKIRALLAILRIE